MHITVVGGGFAGCEAAWAAANRGVRVRLYEMRPMKMTPAHKTEWLAELVCSNSFKSLNPDSPAGQLKAEMEALGSLMIPTARRHAIPGGDALSVERNGFAEEMTAAIEGHPLIEVVREEWHGPHTDEHVVVIATGPLTSEPLAEWLHELTGTDRLHFYDAVAPTVEASSIDFETAWEQSRYDKGEAAYVNCPFDKEQYEGFIDALLASEQAPLHDFEPKYFEGCMPIEEIATRGRESLRHGNFKPVGLTNPRTGKRAYAVLQLRPENREKTLYSMVACQTRMKWGAQQTVLRMIPGLQNAEFVRMGVIHRNTYLDSPRLLGGDCRLRTADCRQESHLNNQPATTEALLRTPFPPLQSAVSGLQSVFFAGQITGVEGYVESGAIGILAGINAARIANGEETTTPPRACAYGCLVAHITNTDAPEFSPMNINWGLMPDPEPVIKDKGARRIAKLKAARDAFAEWLPTTMQCQPDSALLAT